ncbi:matrix-remodeling-associated protein 5-like [Betta splendens]|uniref:Matrix-remodeling-associated protein 5-like n=1 Tax=Betta splendens TaxID=158456 RepID=A0A6P7LFG6_BETSP|nr:matrix-remodeling-associated protein 5-like [Betta splendens]
MCGSVWAPPALLALLVLTLVVPGGRSCPRSCNCYQASEVHCTFRSLLTVPPGLPAHTRRINLGFNSISRIHGGSLVGLKQVELLMLHSNDIHHLPDGGFRDMKSLQILKLSYNKLKEISSSLTFSGLTSLLRLYLDHNLLDHLHPRALLQLPSLRLLRLQGNRLHQLHPQALCTLSLLNTYYFSTLRHLDLSNNSLTTLPKDTLMKTPMLETLVLHTNPWSCDCRMNWLLNWSLAHPGLVKCPGGPQCPTCASPISLQGQGLLDRTDLPCTSPVISSAGRDTPLETDLSEIQSCDAFRDPLGAASLSLSDQQGNSVDLSCNVTHSDSQDIAPLPDLSLSTSSPLPLALSLSLECPVERQSYEKLWRILAYYSETAVRLEREIMLSKAPALAYRYQQSAETGGYYHTGVKASVKVRPHWLLQPAISIQLNRAQSNAHKVHLIYSTRVSAHYGPTSTPPASSSVTHPWVLISANDTITAIAAVAGNAVELPCPHLSSGKPKVQWILPDRSKVLLSSGALDGRLQVSATGLAIQKAELSDAGIYYCVVQAGRDVDVLPVRLAVEESSVPSLGVPMGPSVTGAIGEPVSLSCTASGSPAPVIRWVLPDGSIIKRGLAASRGLTVQANGTLFLQNPSLRDAGYYLCLAINQYGNDYLSIQLELKPHQPPPLRTSFPRGPQSAAGRSTKIRAPLRQQMEEGSGYEEEEEDITLVASRNHPRPLQPPPSKQYPMGKARRRGPVRGRPIPATDQRRNRFDSRHRATPNKKRIDPKKWADLLAKIRQKTHTNSSSQPSISGNPTAKPVGRSKDTEKHEAADNTERDTTEGAMEETDSEGSSVDDTVLQEEGLQPIHAVLKEIQTQRETKTETETQPEKSTHIQTQDPRSQTESMTVTLTPKPMPGKNEIIPEDIIQPANRQELLPNLVPNSRPQRPWNSRRRIEQRRRINRPRVKPLTPHRPLPDPTNPTHHTQNVTPIRITDQTLIMLSLTTKTTSPAILLSTSEYIMPPPSSVAPDPLSSPGSHTVGIVKPASPSLAPLTSSFPSLSPSHTKTHTDMVTRSSDIADTAESTLFNAPTPAPTYSDEVISSTLVPDTRASTFTHGRHAHTQTHTALGKQTARSPGKHTEEVGVLHAPPSTTVSDAQSSTTKVTTRSTTLTSTRLTTSTGSTATISANPITSTIIVIPTTVSTTTTTTTTTATPTVSPKNRFTITSSKTPTKTIASTDTTPTTRVTTSSKTSPATTRTTVSILPTTVTTSTKASSRQGSNVSQTNLTKPGSAAPKQSRPPTEWKNPGANSIPDSHNSRPQTPSHSAVPWAPVVRSRPRIADPHIRAASFPAESSARLACEARGEPKPSITWTKVATGAVMSIHSRAQRFEVLPNGTLVIQNVQLQDRGTYICSAHNFLGRDRLLTTLEVWTRPPRMQLVSYREVTIHQGGELLLQCRADGVPTPTLSWVLPDRSVVTTASRPDSHVAMDTNGTLRISVTLPSDRGVYRCVASNSAGAASSSVRVHVSSLPPVIQQAKEEHERLPPGRPFYAHCSARGAPPPTLRWQIPDGTLVRPSQFLHGNLFVLPNGTLHIRRVGPKDSGSYECMASNAVGADKRTVKVEVEDGANGAINGKGEGKEETKASVTEKTISSLNKNKSLSIPNYLSNSFNSADPSPPLSSDRSRNWPLTPSSSSNRHQPNSANPLLKINKTVPLTYLYINNNTKKVLPNIANNTTSDKSTASDVLQHLPNSHFSKARIVSTSPSVTIVQYGGILQLHCSVTGNPSPIIIWRTPNRKLVDKHFSFDRRLKVHPNGSLSVQAVTEKDAGDFLCIARNKVADDYRLMRVSVVTKPARIEPKQPVTQMVPLGKALKVDCQASGLPDPDVRWSLPDGTMVNSVLQGEDKGGRARRLTVFDNGTLLVPAVGVGEEGEYTCYAENQGGQDTMKVKVKIMATSPPAFSDDRVYRVIKVRQGSTAAIRCQVTADAATSITWFSPAHRVIPQISAAGYYSTRVAVVPSGTLEVRLAQKTDSGNYTCRASNSAGERGMVVGLEVESPTYELGGQVGGRTWTISNGSTNSRSGENTVNNAGTIKYNQVVSSSGDRHKQGSSSGYGNNGWTRHNVPNNGINIENRGSNPALRIYSQNQFNRPVSESTAPSSSSGIRARLSNIGIRAGDTGENRNGAGIVSSRSNSVANSHSQVRGDGIEQNPGSKESEVIVGKANDNASRDQTKIGGVSPNDGPGSSVQNSGGGTGTPSRNGFSIRSSAGLPNRVGKNSTNAAEGVVMTSKQRAVKGHTVLLHCPSEGSPPPRLSWVLPGNGVLPAPYYGSRLTVHRNGSLELRGLRSTDAGPLVCVVRGEMGEQRTRVELEVYEPREEAGSSDGGTGAERTVQKNLGLSETHQSGHLSAQSLSPRTALPGVHPRVPITQHPLQKVLSFPSAPQPVEPPPRSAPQPSVSTRNAPLVSIVNGETLRLPCPAPQTSADARGSLTWTTPGGKVLTPSERSDRHQVQEDGTLTVHQASVFDRGTYTCTSTSWDSSSVSLVTVPVIIIAYPPRITAGPSPLTYTRPGIAVELPCLTIATPQATVTWETPDLTQLKVTGQARIYGNYYLKPQGSLIIQKPTSRDMGFYRCTAKNLIGVDTKVTYLQVI